MNGARKIALDAVNGVIQDGDIVLDVCCGDGWLRSLVNEHNGRWIGIDIKAGQGIIADLSRMSPLVSGVNLAVSAWGLQHLCDREAFAWMTVHDCMADGGLFLYIGRYSQACIREVDRDDPLNGYSEGGIDGLAIATGFMIEALDLYQYERDRVLECNDRELRHRANTIVARMRKR